MTLKKSDVQSFAKAELRSYDLSELSLCEEEALREIEKDIQSEWDELNDPSVMKARFEHFKIEGATPESYRESFKEIDEKRLMLYGIRHFGGDKNLPFVQMRLNFQPKDKSEVKRLYDSIKLELEVFKPQKISLYSSVESDCDLFGSTFLVAKSIDCLNLRPWSSEDEIQFKKIEDDSYYEWFKQGYRSFHRLNPHLEKKVPLNSLETMSESKDEGLLYQAFYQGELMGLIAGLRSSFLGHDGMYFNEIFIDQKWKGKGLAKAIQRKFISITCKGHEYIWGTIDYSNHPSFKTALSNGRKPIRYECFYNLD